MATFNCKFAIFESQQAIIVLELMAALVILALVAGYWMHFCVQFRLAERRVVVYLEALHRAASHLEKVRIGGCNCGAEVIDDGDGYRVLFSVRDCVRGNGLLIVEVSVAHDLLRHEVCLVTCIRAP